MIYVMSDIHGNRRRFDSVLEQINLQPEDTLYVLGDVIDRYPDGIRILRRIMAMPNVKMLLGNHEYMMLRALDQPYDPNEKLTGFERAEATRLWYRNGGKVTHEYWKHIRKDVCEEIIKYLHTVPVNIDITVNDIHYTLVHAAPAENYERHPIRPNNSATEYAVWDRRNYRNGNSMFIFGHTQTLYYQRKNPIEVWYGNHRIGIDCGCGLPENAASLYGIQGRLACLRLDDGKVFYSDEPNVLRQEV